MGGKKSGRGATWTDLESHLPGAMGTIAQIECFGTIQIDSAVDIAAGEMNAQKRALDGRFFSGIASIACGS